MSGLLFAVFGVIPVVVLALLAFVPLLAGFSILLSQPDVGSLLIVWSAAGLAGARTMLQVWSGTVTENTTLGLLAGIVAAAPLSVPSLLAMDLPESLPWLYFTASPIIVAAVFIVNRLLFEPSGNAQIVEYEEV